MKCEDRISVNHDCGFCDDIDIPIETELDADSSTIILTNLFVVMQVGLS